MSAHHLNCVSHGFLTKQKNMNILLAIICKNLTLSWQNVAFKTPWYLKHDTKWIEFHFWAIWNYWWLCSVIVLWYGRCWFNGVLWNTSVGSSDLLRSHTSEERNDNAPTSGQIFNLLCWKRKMFCIKMTLYTAVEKKPTFFAAIWTNFKEAFQFNTTNKTKTKPSILSLICNLHLCLS